LGKIQKYDIYIIYDHIMHWKKGLPASPGSCWTSR